MELILFSLFIGSVILLLVSLFELPHINSLKHSIKQSYKTLPLNTPLNEIAPNIGYVFPDVIPLTTTTLRLGRRPQRITVHVPNCPECGRYLVAREGKFGKFWGCTGYPNCHYTAKYK